MKNSNLQLKNITKAFILSSLLYVNFAYAEENDNYQDSESDASSSEEFNQSFNESYSDEYFYGDDIKLTPQELKALKLTQDWKDSTSNTSPVKGPAGEIQFIYGGQSIDIVCAVLQICDIQLQQGEEVNSIHIGDGGRWNIEPAVTGYGASEIQHIVVKPLDNNLKTNLLVTTNRRTYHINLKSHKSELMPKISFIYPEDAIIKFKVINKKQRSYIANNTIAKTNEYLGALDFNYNIKGDSNIDWTPIRIYNNGIKTIIQLSEKTTYSDIPTLLVLDNKDQEKIVNYRFINNKFIVDAIFKKAVLIRGVGSTQEKVTITYLPKEGI